MNGKLKDQLFALLGFFVVGIVLYSTMISLGSRYERPWNEYHGTNWMMGYCDEENSVMGTYQGEECTNTTHIKTEEGIAALEEYVRKLGDSFRLLEVMEFQNNFYAVIVESDTGIGPFEVLLWRDSGRISPEPGPNMMWNMKYGMRSIWTDGEYLPKIGEVQAVGMAENYLKYRFPDKIIEIKDPIAFYGYYTMDFMLDGVQRMSSSMNEHPLWDTSPKGSSPFGATPGPHIRMFINYISSLHHCPHRQIICLSREGMSFGEIDIFKIKCPISTKKVIVSQGEIHGMLSVNAFTGSVWYHLWHGAFISELEMDSGGGF